MGDKQRKLKDKASRAYSEGDLKDALKLYERVVAEDPSELQCQLKIGDIHRRLGNFEAAVGEYAPVARAYAEDGLLLKAIAVCKMILGIDPDHAGATKLLADLHDKRRGPPATADQPQAGPPVTLQGMGISPPSNKAGQQFGNYGMIDFGGDASGLQAPSIPDDTGGEAWAASEAKPDTPAIVGEPESPPPSAAPAPVSASWPASQSTPDTVVGTPDTPSSGAPPSAGWPATGAPAAPAWPGAGGSTPPPAQEEPKVVVGQRIEDSELDITVGDAIEEIEPIPLESSAFEPASEPAPEKPQLEVVIDADADTEAQLSSLLTELSDDEPVAPAETPVIEAAVTSEPSAEETWDGRVKLEDVDQQEPPSIEDSNAVIELTKPIENTDSDFGRPQIPLFSDLPKNAFIELLVQMDMREVQPGDYVVREGDSGDSFFVLATGQVRVTRKDEEGNEIDLAILTDGAFFGEMAVLQDSPRTASVIAEHESQIFELKKDVLDSVVEQFPSVAKVLRNFYRQRLLSTAMATHPLFRPFSPDERRSLMEMFKSKNFSEGDVLLAEGKKGTGLFILLYGAMEVSKDNDGDKIVLATLGPGDMFGEMSLLTGAPTSATVKAISDCFVLRLSKKKFDEIIMTHPQILELVAMVSDERASINDALLGQESFSAGAVLV